MNIRARCECGKEMSTRLSNVVAYDIIISCRACGKKFRATSDNMLTRQESPARMIEASYELKDTVADVIEQFRLLKAELEEKERQMDVDGVADE